MKYQLSPDKTAFSGLISKALTTVFVTVALLVTTVLAFGQNPEIRKGFRLIDIEQPSKGIAILEQQGPSSAANQYYLGLGYIRTGNNAKALAAFEKGISLDEKNGLNYAGKGHVKLLEKNPTEAKTHFDKALAVSKSKDANVLRAVAEGYLSDSKFLLDAINLLNKAKTLNNADPEIHMVLGDAFLMQNNGGESVNSYERAAKADPKYGKPAFKVAKVFQRSRNNDMVMENLNKSIAADPEFAPAYKELGETYYLKKDPAKAVEAMEKYISITENPGEAKFQLAFFYFMNKQFDKADAIFKEVVKSPDAPAIALKYYFYLLMEKDTTKATALEAKPIMERYFQKAKPENITAGDYGYYGKMFRRIRQDSLAIPELTRSIEMDSAQTEIVQHLAEAQFKTKNYGDAVKTYKQLAALRRGGPSSQDLWYMGQSYYYSGQFQPADTAFTKLSEKQSTVTYGYLWAAKARAQIDSLGETGIAIPMYEKFLELALQKPERHKRDLIDTYDYLGQWALHKENNVLKAKAYFQKILELDPANARANDFMKNLKG